jgi:hypothetical protein
MRSLTKRLQVRHYNTPFFSNLTNGHISVDTRLGKAFWRKNTLVYVAHSEVNEVFYKQLSGDTFTALTFLPIFGPNMLEYYIILR